MATPIYLKFFEGMNRAVSAPNTKPSEFEIVANAISEKIGSKTKRLGYTQFLDNPDNAKVDKVIYWNNLGVQKRMLLRISGDNIYYYDILSGLTTWGAPVKTGLGSSRMSVAVLSGKMFFSNGDGAMFYTTDGKTFTELTVNIKPKYLVVYKGRLYGFGSNSELSGQIGGTGPSTLYFSGINDGTNWTIDITDPSTSGYEYIDPDNNGVGIGMTKSFNRLILFKESADYRFETNNISSQISDLNEITTTSNGSVSSYKDYSFWLNYEGIWGYSGSTPDILSIPLNDIIPAISGQDFQDAQGHTFNKHSYLSIGNITLDDLELDNCVLDLDFDKSQWFVHTFADKPTAFGDYIDGNGKKQMLFGDSKGNTYTMFSGNSDNGKTIKMILRTPVLDEGQPEIDKKYNKMYIEAKPYGSLDVKVRIDGGDWISIGDLYAPLTKYYFDPKNTGSFNRNIQFEITDNSLNARPELKRIIYYIESFGGSK